MSKAKLQYLRSLSQKKNRDREGKFLIEGWKMLEEAMSAGRRFEIFLYTSTAKAQKSNAILFHRFLKLAHQDLEFSEREFAQITNTVTAQGVAAVVQKNRVPSISEILKHQNETLCVVLEEITEPGNLGSIIRTCDWFGADAVFLSRGCVELYNPKVVRSTVGSLFHLPLFENVELPNVLTEFHQNGFRCYGAELVKSTDMRGIHWSKRSVLVIGNEARGISPEVSQILDEHVLIPKYGSAESLNAGVACGVLLSYFRFRSEQ